MRVVFRLFVCIFFLALFFLGSDFAYASPVNLRYGYYGAPPFSAEENISSFTNTVFYSCSSTNSAAVSQGLDYAVNHGYKVICTLSGYFQNYYNLSEAEWRNWLSALKTRLGANSTKIWAFYLFDEPELNEEIKKNPSKVGLAINLTKEFFPAINTMIVFHSAYSARDSPIEPLLTNPDLDLIGTDPYFLTGQYEDDMNSHGLDPYACGSAQKQEFDQAVQPRIYWIKSGGEHIQRACLDPTTWKSTWPEGCTQSELTNINNILNKDTNKKIFLVGQSFTCKFVNGWIAANMPSKCQQKWYYDLAKSDPDIMGLLWYQYATLTAYNNYLKATSTDPWCYGPGRDVPISAYPYAENIYSAHQAWGIEILCNNQEIKPFCVSTGVSYKNADQAKCAGKNVTKLGGAGTNLCDSACGADAICSGKAPGTNNCNSSCKFIIRIEVCNNIDDDGDGLIDEGCDDDKDTFWDNAMICDDSYRAGNGMVYQCKPEWSDLNDTNPRIGSEKCNNKDDDIDGRIDDGCDDDKDTFWDKDMICNNTYLAGNNVTYQCKPEWSDCNDMDASIKHTCPDINGDGNVDIADLIIIITDFGKTSNFKNPKSDTNGDNIVDIYDVVFVASRFT